MHIIYPIAVLCIFLSPDSIQGNILQIGSFLLLIMLNRKELKLDSHFNSLFFLLIFLASFFSYLLSRTTGISMEELAKNLLVLFFILYFPFRITKYALPRWLLFGMLIVIFVSQIILIFNLEPLAGQIRQLYYSEKSLTVRSADRLWRFVTSSYRSGGFLGNPNQAAKVVSLLLACYLALNAKHDPNKRWLMMVFIGLALSSILLTGSRTGLLVCIAILLAAKATARIWILSTICIFVLLFLNPSSALSMRILNIRYGLLEGSMHAKLLLLNHYIGTIQRPDTILIGNFLPESGPVFYPYVFNFVAFNLDSDLGYVVYAFGFLGATSILVKLTLLVTHTDHFRILSPLLLWTLSASIFFHFRFLLLFMVLLSLVLYPTQIIDTVRREGSLKRIVLNPTSAILD